MYDSLADKVVLVTGSGQGIGRALATRFGDAGCRVAANDVASVRRVLDVGCGPGTNTRYFEHADYLGLDINRGYIESARRRFKSVTWDTREPRARRTSITCWRTRR